MRSLRPGRHNDIEKFLYLRSFLKGEALSCIEGIAICAENYQKAFRIVQDRFGDSKMLVASFVDVLMKHQAISDSRSTRKLRAFFDTIQNCIQNLKSLQIISDSYGPILIPCIFSKLPDDLHLDLTKSVNLSDWNLDQLLACMEKEIKAREACNFVADEKRTENRSENKPKNLKTNSALYHTQNSTPTVCVYCDGTHKSWECTNIVEICDRKAVIVAKKLCFNCLNPSHQAARCKSKKNCVNCGQRHHSSICTKDKTDASCNVAGFKGDKSEVIFLKTAKTWALNPENSCKSRVRILLDEGSQRTYITSDLCSKLSLSPVSSTNLVIQGACGQATSVEKCPVVKFALKATDGTDHCVSAHVLKNICAPLKAQPLLSAKQKFSHLHGISFSDMHDDKETLPIDILLGADLCNRFVTPSKIMGESADEPVANLTKFGWVLLGPMTNDVASENREIVQSCVTHTLKCTEIDRSNDRLLQKFWDLDTLGILPEEKTVHESFENEIEYNSKGEFYSVGLPWRESCSQLPDNFDVCVKRLASNIRKLKREPEILREYDAIFQSQLEQGIIEKCEDPQNGSSEFPVHYLPHRAVVREDKSSTKVRIVFDASSKISKTSLSLNQCLFKGPQLTPLLFDILVRFRSYPVAFVCDLEKAFHQIRVKSEQRDALRFLWVKDIDSEEICVVMYRFCRVVFGLTSSPFLLNGTLRHHFNQFLSQFPEIVPRIIKSLYVDDFIGGGNSREEVVSMVKIFLTILKSAGFKGHKFLTNEQSVMEALGQGETRECENESYSDDLSFYSSQTKVLGLPWHPLRDEITFDFGFLEGNVNPTKRQMLSMVSKIFDPLGVLSPIIVFVKCLFQQCCRRKIGWDESLPSDLTAQWVKYGCPLYITVFLLKFPGAICLRAGPFQTTRKFFYLCVYMITLQTLTDTV